MLGGAAMTTPGAPAALGDDGDGWMTRKSSRKPTHMWRHLDLNLLSLFFEIARHGGVSAAARALGRQQPATSQALARLEDHVGAKLCERGPGGFALTPEGEIVYGIAAEMVALAREAPDRLAQAMGEVRGKLSIAVMSSVVSKEFDAILNAMARRHPLLEIAIDLAPWRTVIQRVRVGEIDLGLCYDRELQPDLAYEPLFIEFQQLYCSPTHPLFGETACNPSELSSEVFFLTGRDEPLELTNFRRRHGLGQKARGGSEDLGELKRLVLTGGAIGFLPTRCVAEETARREMWPLLPRLLLPSYPVNLVARLPTAQTLPVQLFLNEARRLSAARDDPAARFAGL